MNTDNLPSPLEKEKKEYKFYLNVGSKLIGPYKYKEASQKYKEYTTWLPPYEAKLLMEVRSE